MLALDDAPLWSLALIYSNTVSRNTFPVPTLTCQNKTDLTCGAEEALAGARALLFGRLEKFFDMYRNMTVRPLPSARS